MSSLVHHCYRLRLDLHVVSSLVHHCYRLRLDLRHPENRSIPCWGFCRFGLTCSLVGYTSSGKTRDSNGRFGLTRSVVDGTSLLQTPVRRTASGKSNDSVVGGSRGYLTRSVPVLGLCGREVRGLPWVAPVFRPGRAVMLVRHMPFGMHQCTSCVLHGSLLPR